ncbi:uncharacterized protein LOC127834188 [Dreissena polymorpha]|uniref:Poly [ADP-ribose] polymerase n=1 Tax=Dreissena polymorpha TaxID=45954 RepID=A0A9D4MVQ2_DREPO|nr:uncharacterized protein LOC127834188 [Dreissena polymorpha]XP_052215802.1 uncharacterized protein LOC127834188 [Dreissena polymorpha]XP_052215810.1 uncharacterized protein LOC127834188 [Dreissena polymorpha]KAH3883401.1 hypothetical protein DPMN_007356 [Dreissena polymorpha]
MAATNRPVNKKRRPSCSGEYNEADDYLDLTDTSLESAEMYLSMNLSDQTAEQNTTADFFDSGLGSEQLLMSESMSLLSSQSERHNSSIKIGLEQKNALEEKFNKKPRHSLDFTSPESDLDVDDALDDSFLAEVVSDDDAVVDHIMSALDDVSYDAEPTSKKQRIHPYSSKKGKQPFKGKARFKFTPTREMNPIQQQMPREEFESVLEEWIPEDEPMTIPVAKLKTATPPVKLACQGCDSLFSHLSLIECCEGHFACNECATKKTKQVLTGEKKGSVGCPKLDCNSSLPISELRKVHPVMVIELLEDKWNKETMEALEQMSDVVKCPECSLALVVDEEVKRFKCAQCSNSFCRHCMKKWQCNEHDLCISLKPWTSSYSGKMVNIPAFWEDPTPNQVYSLIDLSTTSMEFVDIIQHVQKFMKCDVKKIFRIQNHKIWEKYSVTRSHMIEELGMRLTYESRLFHGTDVSAIEAICNEGFDLRVSGKNAVAFGNGIYFARSAAYSHRYTRKGGHGQGFSAATLPNLVPLPQFSSNAVASVISLHPPISSNQSGNLMRYGGLTMQGTSFGPLMTPALGSISYAKGICTVNQQVVQSNQIVPPTNQLASNSNTAMPHDPFRSSIFGKGLTQSWSQPVSASLAANAAGQASVFQLQQARQQVEGAHKMLVTQSIGTAAISYQKGVPSQHVPSCSFQTPADSGTSTVTRNMSTAVAAKSENVVQNARSSGGLIKGSASQNGMLAAEDRLNWNIGDSVSKDPKSRLDYVNSLRQNEQQVLKALILRFCIANNENELKSVLLQFRKPSKYKIALKYGVLEKREEGTFTFTIIPGIQLTDALPCNCHRIPRQICDHLLKGLSFLKDATKRVQAFSFEKREKLAKYFASALYFMMDSSQQSKSTASSVYHNPSVPQVSKLSLTTGDSKTNITLTKSSSGNMSTNSASFRSGQLLAGSHLQVPSVCQPSQSRDVQPSKSLVQSNSTGMLRDDLTRLITGGANSGSPSTSHSQQSNRIGTDLLGICKCHRLPLTLCKIKKLARLREDLRLKESSDPAVTCRGARTNMNFQLPQTGVVQQNIPVNTITLQGSNPGGSTMQPTSRLVTTAHIQSSHEPEPMDIDNGSHKTLFDVAAAHASNDCFMVVARVLVGRICQGSKEMRRPAKDPSGLATHTAVDNMASPQIFVVFDNTQCYPEYLVRYSSSL